MRSQIAPVQVTQSNDGMRVKLEKSNEENLIMNPECRKCNGTGWSVKRNRACNKCEKLRSKRQFESQF